MNNKVLLFLIVLAMSFSGIPAARAQEPADTLREVRPFGTHALDLLVGREAGVEVISSLGAPGMTPTIHVRGLGVLPGIPPVYVVDGMRRRDLEGIAPEAIEKIEVLKDAAAMGLYGPDAAAGVVVVTTKKASQEGFHAGYDFVGGFQFLAHEPEKMTLADWQGYDNLYKDPSYREQEAPVPEPAFLQNHHLHAQYGGKKLSAYAGFSLLDNDGPYPGKADTYRRYAASWSVGYRPLEWLSLETTGRWNRSAASRAQEGWLKQYLVARPIYGNLAATTRYSDWPKRSEAVVQGKLDIHPLPGLYIRGVGGYARGQADTYMATWTDYESADYPDRVSARAGYERMKWYQWGVEAGWSGQWRDHRLRVDGKFHRVKEAQDNQVLYGQALLSDVGLAFGEDGLLEERFLLPYYERYKTDWQSAVLEQSQSLPYKVGTPEMKWKESVLSVGYAWKDRYQVDFSYFRLWEEKLFSSEGWRVPAVTLGWTLSEEPLLHRVLPHWWTDWSVKATWSRTDPYVPLLDDIGRWLGPGVLTVGTFTSGVSTAARHRDLTTSLSFRSGEAALDLSAAWYVHDDDLTEYYSYFISGQDIESRQVSGENGVFTLRNRGVELSGAIRGNAGPLRYGVSAHLTFYGNRITFGEWLKAYEWFNWQKDSPLGLKNGETVGGAMVMPGDGSTYTSYDDRVWKGSVFPSVTGGIRASLGWERWQLTVSGHGDGGQTIRGRRNDPLTRYFYERFPGHSSLFESAASVLDASFFRIDQLRLDYTLPLRSAVRLDLFASLENGILFTRYPGSDPELALHWDNLGVDTATYPSTRRMLFGLKAGF
jgi:TonB-dependent SusC/RagA subfamily outer membrane receptor